MGGKPDLHVTVKYEHLLPGILHQLLTEIVDEPADRDWLPVRILSRDFNLMLALIREEHLQATPWHGSISLSAPTNFEATRGLRKLDGQRDRGFDSHLEDCVGVGNRWLRSGGKSCGGGSEEVAENRSIGSLNMTTRPEHAPKPSPQV